MNKDFPKVAPTRSSYRGFTLVELLVAIAVFAVLTLFLAQVVSMASQAITTNGKRLDSAEQARAFFDRLAMDLAARPRRADLGMLFTKATGNDSLQFYSAVNSYTTSARQVTWVSYQIPGPPYQLDRGANGTVWTGSGGPPVAWMGSIINPFASNPPTAAATNNLVLGSGIFRLEFSFLFNNNNGTLSGTFTNGSNSSSPVTAPSYSNVTALVVGVAVLDGRSLALLNGSPTLIATLSGDLEDTVDGDDPLKDWNTQMLSPTFGTGIPPQVVQNVRLYERTFSLP